ncbi:MAG: phospholipase [Azospira oryzae]|jgi:phospholipase/carboxylesterase|nr:MAG: phospholipase [Azospira oryzae]
MHQKKIISAGKKLTEAKKAVIFLHGRGASAEDILSLASHLEVTDYALLAPQATNHTWYPFPFISDPQQNEPWLSSALELVKEMVGDINKAGIPSAQIYFVGFSQGACLTLEFVTRHAVRWGGVAAFTGGLIGDRIYSENYQGDFASTPVFIGSSNPDPHIPVPRVKASTAILKSMNAIVTEKIYPNMGHTINQDEIETVNRLIFNRD